MEYSNWNPQKMIGGRHYLAGDLWLQLGSPGRAGVHLFCVLLTGSLLTWTFASLVRPHCEGSEHWDFTPASRGTVWARRLLVPVCGLELSRHYEESEGVCAHCLWVIARGHAWVQNDGNGLKLLKWLIWHQRTLVIIPIPKLSIGFCVWNIVPLKSAQNTEELIRFPLVFRSSGHQTMGKSSVVFCLFV